MPRPLLILLLVFAAKVGCTQDLTGRKYFSFSDSVFHVGDVKILREIYIYDGHEIRPPSFIVLDSVVEFLKTNPQLNIEVGYFTDSVGRADYNLKFSEHLSFFLITYFLNKGIDTSRLASKGYGESLFIAPNSKPNGKDNFEGRKLNRRFEIKITSTGKEKNFQTKYYVDGIPMRGSISLPDSSLEQLQIITDGIGDFGDMNGGIVPSFECMYKISFLNQTVEYGRRMAHDTIPIYSIYGDFISDTVVAYDGEGLLDNTFIPVSSASVPATPQQVVVTSCDGTIVFEIENISIKRLMEENVTLTLNGNAIDFNALIAESKKWNTTLYQVSISSIYLKGINSPILLSADDNRLIILKK